MTDDEEQTQAPAPSPSAQMFARPPAASQSPAASGDGQPHPAAPAAKADSSPRGSTGDARVDDVIAHLPDAGLHRQEPDDGVAGDPQQGGTSGDDAADSDSNEALIGDSLPDPSLLDEHIADITSVHRQLQQRLSDLSN